MAPKEEKRRFWIYSNVEEEDHTALMKIAAMEGKHITAIVEQAVQVFINIYTMDHKNNAPHVELRAMALEDRIKQMHFTMIKQLAYSYTDNPTEEGYESLKRACDLAQISIETVLDNISAKQSVMTMVSLEPNSLSAAELWLIEQLEPNQKYAVNIIRQLAEDRGFRWHTITDAKRKLGIKSLKENAGWAWIREVELTESGSARLEDDISF